MENHRSQRHNSDIIGIHSQLLGSRFCRLADYQPADYPLFVFGDRVLPEKAPYATETPTTLILCKEMQETAVFLVFWQATLLKWL